MAKVKERKKAPGIALCLKMALTDRYRNEDFTYMDLHGYIHRSYQSPCLYTSLSQAMNHLKRGHKRLNCKIDFKRTGEYLKEGGRSFPYMRLLYIRPLEEVPSSTMPEKTTPEKTVIECSLREIGQELIRRADNAVRYKDILEENIALKKEKKELEDELKSIGNAIQGMFSSGQDK